MKGIIICTVYIIAPLFSMCQSADKIANSAFVLLRMVDKFHVAPREVNDAFSADVFAGMLNRTDDDRILFTMNDMSRLSAYRTRLDDEIKNRKSEFLSLFIQIYQRRLMQTDSLIAVIAAKPLNFYAKEKLTIAEDTLYPVSLAAKHLKLDKIIKAGVLDELADNVPGNIKSFEPAKQKKYLDSTLATLQKKECSALQRKIENILQNPNGITQYVGDIYCETIASCFDPHTEFFPPDEKENFESALGKQPFQFGFRMKPDKNGGVLIDNLQPGSPAFKSGKLNKGDKFMSLQFDGAKAIDVSDATVSEFIGLIDESNHKSVLFLIKKADGSSVQVPLQKALAVDDEDDKVKSFILKGAANVGYIYLPAFYQDWETNNDGLNGCANDVGREILKLKKENISGLIVDVRFNGGGSVSEATELAGIFIGAGPMAQEKSRDDKVHAIKNTDRGTIFDGPLVLLVNGASASASELLAGTLQDYNRAIIIGSPTYGKATMQVVLPMDTTVTPQNFAQIHTENYLKVTISKLYRINGTSAQFKGVLPDILLPDLLDAYITKEEDEPYALKPTVITPNKYYTPFSPLPIKTLAQNEQTLIDTSKYLIAVKDFIASSKQRKAERDISLNVGDALDTMDAVNKIDGAILIPDAVSKKFTVQNNLYEMERLKSDSNLKEMNGEFSRQVAADPYISVAYDVVSQLNSK